MKNLGLILIFLLALPVGASIQDDVGFTRLKSELGDRLPTGSGVSIGQVESSMEVEQGAGKIRTWMPDTGDRHLQAHNIVDRSGAPAGAYSRHASAVARRLLGRGRDQGMASEIALHQVYSVSHWLGMGMLRGRTRLAPDAGPLRLVNHSWAADSQDSDILRRSDWLTNRDEIITVVGVRNSRGKVNGSLLAASVNAIVVGRSDGEHSVGTPAINDIYVAGRVRPHLVAPLTYTSAAAPTVASAVILLLETAGNPALSTRPEPVRNRHGVAIFDAGRSEVIRAVLMAAADRTTDNSSGGDISSYRDSIEHRSDNGLDFRYGAGQLNIYNAWHILHAGEQEQDIGLRGFDYEPGLGGFDAPGETKRYVVPTVSSPTQLTTTLSWNLLFPFSSATRFDVSAVLNDLDLLLVEISDGQERLLQAATSRIDSTETIQAVLQPGKRYQLVVSRVDGGKVAQDYAIAWHMLGVGAAR